jgi:pyruvate dehydrogenase E1 component alpha subunit
MKSSQKNLFYNVLKIRLIEERLIAEYPKNEMRCPVHFSIGQEAVAVGVGTALSKDDYALGSHRSHAHYLMKGGDLKAFLCELYGKEAGCARGQGGSMHLIDLSVNFLGSTSIVGATIPVGVGTAYASKLRKEDRVTAVFFGDAALEEGVTHESMNFASVHKLNVLFCCENNRYSCFTPLAERQPDRPLTDVAKGHAVETHVIDGNDVFAIFERTGLLLDEMRKRPGPRFIEFPTYRFVAHCGPKNDDNYHYRPVEEVAAWRARDPINLAREELKSRGEWSETLEQQIRAEIEDEIENGLKFAKEASFPGRELFGAFTYAP